MEKQSLPVEKRDTGNDFAIFPPGTTEEQKATFRRNVAKWDAERGQK